MFALIKNWTISKIAHLTCAAIITGPIWTAIYWEAFDTSTGITSVSQVSTGPYFRDGKEAGFVIKRKICASKLMSGTAERFFIDGVKYNLKSIDFSVEPGCQTLEANIVYPQSLNSGPYTYHVVLHFQINPLVSVPVALDDINITIPAFSAEERARDDHSAHQDAALPKSVSKD